MNRADRLAKGIYWDRSWNPFTGCSPIGAGCDNCWARRMAHRLRGRCGYPADEPFRPTFHPERLDQVNPKQKPQMIALCFMSDPFHDEHLDMDIYWMLKTIRKCSQHIFIALTKRAGRMKFILDSGIQPIPNLVGGVSVWDQKSADRMIPTLLQTNLATRIVSYEPALGAVDFTIRYNAGRDIIHNMDSLRGYGGWGDYNRSKYKLDGVILGGESGPGARPMHPGWVRSVRDQCQAASVPLYFKGWGEWIPCERYGDAQGTRYWKDSDMCSPKGAYKEHNFTQKIYPYGPDDGFVEELAVKMLRVGKKAAGRLLDGRTWDELPEVLK